MGGQCAVHESLFHVLHKYPTEQRVQIEAIRSLITLTDHSIEILYRIEQSFLITGMEDDLTQQSHAEPYLVTLKKSTRSTISL